ncbi:MAG: hypothetical protein M0Z30_10895 [Actinomycetota bacterium]|nr:hypothetical protein [Actinomycetota bacterium]
MTILVDPDVAPEDLLATLYAGNLVVLTRLPGVWRLVEYSRQKISRLFHPLEPETAHEQVDKSAMAAMLAAWKPGFIHSPDSHRFVRDIIRQAGFAAEGTHYDSPRPRTSFPLTHLTTGIAYAFPWHRDTWYSAPAQQINWWLPIYPIRADNSMGFHPSAFDQAVRNNSDRFDYYENNRARLTTALQVDQEHQVRPAATELGPVPELAVLPSPGSILLFSGAQLHRSIPNTSGRARFSVDFRTVDVADVKGGRGAPLLDVACTGTSIRDFLRVADGEPFDEQTVVDLFGRPPDGSSLVFRPPPMDGSQLPVTAGCGVHLGVEKRTVER